MRALGSIKWLVLVVLASGCARGGPPAPVFDRMLSLLQTNKVPTTTVQLRGRIGGDDVLIDKRINTDTFGAADNASDGERAAPIPRVKVEQVAPFNDVQDPGVQTGQPAGVQLAALPNAAGQPAITYHTVARGDTLYNISRRYAADVATLAERNSIRPPYIISLGQRIELPPVAGAQNPAPVTVAATTPPPAARPAVAQQVIVNQPAPQPRRPATRAAPPLQFGAPGSQLAARPLQLAAAGGPRSKPSIPPRLVGQATVAIGAPPPRAGGPFAWPVDGPILVGYGPTGNGLHNDGLNIAAPMEAPVRAAENGVVAYAGNEIRGFGKLVLIKHDGGLITAYGHNNDLLVRRGDVVRKGQVIARVGASGGVDVPQLHFEIREGRRAVDPSKLLPGRSA